MLSSDKDKIVFEGDTEFEHYQVIDTIYDHRPARVLYSGRRAAAQSGIARDDNSNLLFDYNQRFLELITGLSPKRLLVIGGGVYTLPMAAIKALPGVEIDVVELDPGLDKIAESFFGLRPDMRLNIMHGDGREYLEANSKTYDMIIIDAFINLEIPKSLSTPEAAEAIMRNLAKKGVVAMNIIATYRGGRNDILRRQAEAFASTFKKVEIFPASNLYSLWLPQNLILTGQKGGGKSLEPYMRHKALSPLV